MQDPNLVHFGPRLSELVWVGNAPPFWKTGGKKAKSSIAKPRIARLH